MTATISKYRNLEDKKIVIEPIKKSKKKYDLNELVSKIPKDYKASEDIDSSMGIEKW